IVAVAWLTKRWWPRRRHAWIAGTIAVVVTVSLAASITLTAQLGPEAYYLPQTRFWELGVGALLALFVHRIAPANRGLATATGALGVALVVGAALVLTTTTSYPGVAAVAP